METIQLNGMTSDVIVYSSSCNDGKASGTGSHLTAISYGRSFVLVKDGVKYKAKTLKELKAHFSGFIIESITYQKFVAAHREKK